MRRCSSFVQSVITIKEKCLLIKVDVLYRGENSVLEEVVEEEGSDLEDLEEEEDEIDDKIKLNKLF